MAKLKELFHIEYGNQADFNKLEPASPDDGIRFISRSSRDLGFQGYVKRESRLKVYKKGSITVTLGGTYLLSAFVQPDDFYTAQNIKVLSPSVKMTEAEKYFYCYVISQNRFRYSSHGREANKTLDDLIVPSLKELPQWLDSAISKVKEPNKKPVYNKIVSLRHRDWKWINLKDYFNMGAGKYYPKNSYTEGETPLVTSSDNNNGVMTFTDLKPKHRNCLTIGKIGCSVYYQENGFVASSDVTVLIPKFSMNSYQAIFIVTILSKEGYKWSYGRQIRLNDSEKLKIKLPVTKDGTPDWAFMEYYIKSLPFSSNLKQDKKDKGLTDSELIEKYESGEIDMGEKLKETLDS